MTEAHDPIRVSFEFEFPNAVAAEVARGGILKVVEMARGTATGMSVDNFSSGSPFAEQWLAAAKVNLDDPDLQERLDTPLHELPELKSGRLPALLTINNVYTLRELHAVGAGHFHAAGGMKLEGPMMAQLRRVVTRLTPEIPWFYNTSRGYAQRFLGKDGADKYFPSAE